jgi:pyruvate/2-oxoglutarate dehydrogenase complex dihydrolipoamide dehydrogenase (E3) component
MLSCKYLIIGSGETGLILARELAKSGQKIILAEQNEIGGSFLHSLDIPKNILKSEAEDFATGLRMYKNHPDTFTVLRKYRQKIQEKIWEKTKLQKNKLLNNLEKIENLEIIKGKAEITSKSLAEINSETERHLVGFEQVIVAIGKSGIQKITDIELKDIDFLHKHNIFLFHEIPSKLAILGCTLETLEIASIYAGLGVKVNIYESLEVQTVMPKLDRAAFNYVIKSLMKRNVSFNFETNIKEVQKNPETKELTLIDDKRQEYKNSHIYIRVQEIFSDDSVNLNKLGIRQSPEGIIANGNGRTVQTNISVLGNCFSQTSKQNKYANIFDYTEKELKKNSKNPSSLLGISSYFSEGEVSPNNLRIIKINSYEPVINIGLSERNAKAVHGTYIKVDIIENLENENFIKIIYKENTGQILGIVLAGKKYSELEIYAVVSLKKNSNYKQVRNFIRSYWGI